MLTNNSHNNDNNASDRQRTDYNDIIKCGFMIKRSQNKKRFTSVNYKRRWFELNLVYLHYFDIQNDQVSYVYDYCILFFTVNLYIKVVYNSKITIS